MAVNLPNNPANGDSVLLNGTTYVYNSTNNSWDIPVVTEAILPLTSLSVGPEATPSGDGAISYDNTTGIFTYTPPVISGGSGITAYANTTDLPTSEVTTGAMAYVSANNKLYIWNGTAWFNIAIVNQAPTAITGNLATYVLATDGTPTVVTLVSTDPEGLPLTWSSSTSGDTQVGTLSQTDNVFTITPSTNEANIGTLSVTFSVTDGNNTETSVSSFILEFLSPYWNETVLSIGTSSTNGLANSTFIDRSTNAHTVTPTGAPVQTAFHPYLENWGVEFPDGANKYLSVAANNDFNFGTGDFTIECWYYRLPKTITDTDRRYLIHSEQTWDGTRWTLYAGFDNNKFSFFTYQDYLANSNTPMLVSSSDASLHQWHHIAITRSGNTFRLFINGVLEASSTRYTGSVGADTYTTFIGGGGNQTNRVLSGIVSDVRIVKGTALYTTNFTPPTEKLTAVTGTSLLTCQSNRFVDNSSNAHTITPAGNVTITAFNPFGQESEYAAGENKGSAYFDGTGDYLTVASDAGFGFGTGDFTIEAWVYWLGENSNASYGIVSTRSSVAAEGLVLYAGVSGFLTYYDGPANGNYASTQKLPINQWSYVVLTRSSNVWRLFLNGLEIKTHTSSSDLGSSQPVRIGSLVNGDTFAFNGYISNVRIVKGTALYTSNFTPPTAPVGNTNASLYLPMDNAGIFDKTGNNTFTPVGNASTSTTQTKYADTAMYFDGSGDYIEIDNQPLFNFGTQDFTIEMWIKPNVSSNFGGLFTIDAGPYPSVLIYNSGTNNIRIYLDDNNSSPFALTQNVTIPSTNWQHFAFTRDGNIFRSFLDGILINTTTSSITIAPQRARARIGTGDSGSPWNGYIENFQILKGVAKYTANFTPPNRTQGITYQEES